MRKIHIYLAIMIFSVTFGISYFLEFPITNYTAQNLVTSFAIFFGFYLTTISTLFGSNYMSNLRKVDSGVNTYTADIVLYKYFLASGSLSLFSIICILILSFFSKLNKYSELIVSDEYRVTLISNAFVLGVSSVNFLFVLIIFKMLLGGLLSENNEDLQ